METNSKILIVDDERFHINILVELLKGKYKLFIAKSGEQALKRISDNQPDLILLDIMMPDMDGYQTCQTIKQQPLWADIPIIFLSGHTDQNSETKAFDCGAVDFINKPLVPATVRARINTHLSLLHTCDALQKQNQLLEEKSRERTHEIKVIQDVFDYINQQKVHHLNSEIKDVLIEIKSKCKAINQHFNSALPD